MIPFKSLTIVASIMALSACTTSTNERDPYKDLGILWVRHAAEYRAIAIQTYRSATDDLQPFIQDTTWNAMTGYGEPSAMPPAVILDVDETVVSNVEFQLTYEPPFTNQKLDTWTSNNNALAVPGVQSFVHAARSLGVTVFFVTNRPCQPIAAIDDPCPQKQTTLDDIRELGISVDSEHLMLANERPGWDREKQVRREHVARTHRVIMLIGDDLSDFIACVRKSPHGACTEPATSASRDEALEKHSLYWGNGWYMLPNPMHGSWTSVL